MDSWTFFGKIQDKSLKISTITMKVKAASRIEAVLIFHHWCEENGYRWINLKWMPPRKKNPAITFIKIEEVQNE